MSETDLTVLLEQTADRSPAPDPGIIDRSIAAGERRVRRRTATRVLGAAAALAVVAAGATWTINAKVADRTPATSAAEACRRDYTPRVLPAWATTGFSSPNPTMPYVLGDRGDIVAILWAEHDPLVVPPAQDRNNKILWVGRVASEGSLQIKAHLIGSDRSVTRTVDGGPGPSIIDLPDAGCWSLDLTWGKQHDHLQLEYAPS
ncbi:hypothetical protein [Nocardioides pocheonensis]|uniref:hypothetical protein n=1 Tax=Nocardioides pocheonensis TaxID=661485 RepID=UPI001C838DE3|nr:hypothetical protein [Nocardioides pocheonensis]